MIQRTTRDSYLSNIEEKKKQTFKGLGLLYTQMISESSEMTSDAAVF